MNFEQLGLIEPIITMLQNSGFYEPTPIQRGTIPPALEGRDVLGCAQSGAGKTCAFVVPVLQRLSEFPRETYHKTRALVLTPTRQTAIKILSVVQEYGRPMFCRSVALFGGVDPKVQIRRLVHGADVLIATPGRLMDLYRHGHIDLAHIEILVMDEANRLLEFGLLQELLQILQLLPEKRQTLLFSSVLSRDINDLATRALQDYVKVEVDSSPGSTVQQLLYSVEQDQKTRLLAHLMRKLQMSGVLVFSNARDEADQIAQDLVQYDIPAVAIHGAKSQVERREALTQFKDGSAAVLVATDLAARGINMSGLDWVVNYDLPESADLYLHRIGRTGRANQKGTALSFCAAQERSLLEKIEQRLNAPLPVAEEQSVSQLRSGLGNQTASPASWTQRLTGSSTAPRGKRGVRQKNLNATMPAHPSTPATEFIRPNPLDSDTIMDATARLLTSKSNAHSTKTFLRPYKSRTSTSSTANDPEHSRKTSSHQKKVVQSSLESNTRDNGKRVKSKRLVKGTPVPKPYNQKGYNNNYRNYNRTRPIERYGNHQKDSTEQSESVMKPYYLSDG